MSRLLGFILVYDGFTIFKEECAMKQLMINTNLDDLFDLTDNPDEECNFEIPSYLKKRRKVCGLYEPTECKGNKKKEEKQRS